MNSNVTFLNLVKFRGIFLLVTEEHNRTSPLFDA